LTVLCPEIPHERKAAKRYRLWYDPQTREFSKNNFWIFRHD
jgi:hypothetical protein